MVVALAAALDALMVAVALMTEAGFAGNLRYVALPAAMVCVLAGAGWVGLFERARPRARPRAAAALAARRAGGLGAVRRRRPAQLGTALDRLASEADLYGANLGR